MIIIFLKTLLAVGAGLLGVWATRTRMVELPERRFLQMALALQLVPALAMFVALYVIGHEAPSSDVPGYYLPAAHATVAGEVPFRDFTMSYAPLFGYVGALLVLIWDSGKTFALLAIAANAAALWCWHRAASACLKQPVARQSTLLYATSGHMLVQALLGTNQPWIGAALGASAWLMAREQSVLSGLVQALAAVSTKILAHLFWPLLWICAPRRSRWLAAAVLPTVAIYVVFWCMSSAAQLLYPVTHEGELTSSGNLPYVLEPLLAGSDTLEWLLFNGLALIALGAVTVWLYLRSKGLDPRGLQTLLLAGLALTGLVFMLFSKKSFTGYLVFVMYPLVAMTVLGMEQPVRRALFLLLFNVLLVAEPSLWFHLGGAHRLLSEWSAHGGGAAAEGFVALDLALLACYVYLARLSMREVGNITVRHHELREAGGRI